MGAGVSSSRPGQPKSAGSVFLGGSCGASTWRAEVACPVLDRLNVPYFNPQVPPEQWTPDMIPMENAAKESAAVLLFVIDASTRGVMSVAEAAFYLGTKRNVVLFVEDVAVGEGNFLNEEEVKDLNRGRKFLRSVDPSCVCSTVEDAVRRAADLARGSPGHQKDR
jgi:hypothetical protein